MIRFTHRTASGRSRFEQATVASASLALSLACAVSVGYVSTASAEDAPLGARNTDGSAGKVPSDAQSSIGSPGADPRRDPFPSVDDRRGMLAMPNGDIDDERSDAETVDQDDFDLSGFSKEDGEAANGRDDAD